MFFTIPTGRYTRLAIYLDRCGLTIEREDYDHTDHRGRQVWTLR